MENSDNRIYRGGDKQFYFIDFTIQFTDLDGSSYILIIQKLLPIPKLKWKTNQ